MRILAALPLALSMAATVPLALHPAFAQQRPPATGVPAGPGGADISLFRAPPLDQVAFVMAYHRLAGTSLDFRPFVERSAVYRNATAFDRPELMTREISRLEGQMASLDLNRVHVMRLGTQLRQYDAARGGYPIALNPDSFIRIEDPINYRALGLQFRNSEEVAFIPMPDTTAARNFAQRNGFNLQFDTAGSIVMELAFRLVDVPPDAGNMTAIVRADILAARALVQGNPQPIWAFAPTTAAGTAPATALLPGQVPLLKAADIQGLRVGMPIAEARGIASREYPTARPYQDPASGGRHFRGLENEQGANGARCGLDPLPAGADLAASMQSYMQGGDLNPATPVADTSEACVGFTSGETAAPNRAVTGRVARVTSGQRLPGTAPEAVLTALREKYGAPTSTQDRGNTLRWIGRDPARPDEPPVDITARVSPRQGGGTLFGIEAKAYVDPRPRPAPAAATPAAPTGPRL